MKAKIWSAVACCGGVLLLAVAVSWPASARWREEFANVDPVIRAWYESRNMTEATMKRLGWHWRSCCDHGDVVHTQFDHRDVFGKGEWYYMAEGDWKLIPEDTVQYGQSPPKNEPVLFVYYGKEVCFFPPDAGGI
jgi:hypothetical protein